MEKAVEVSIHVWKDGGFTVYITLPEGCDCKVRKQNPVERDKDPGYETEPVNKVTDPDDEGILYDNLD